MQRRTASAFLATLWIATLPHQASAHIGRSFIVEIPNGKLQAQGLNTQESMMETTGPRPYANAIHDHFTNNANPDIATASANLPGFSTFQATAFSDDITLTLIDSFKWDDVSSLTHHQGHVPMGTIPSFDPLGVGETIDITDEYGTTIDTDTMGALSLAIEPDVDLIYDIGLIPQDTIYVLVFTMSSPGLIDSDPVYVILSPDGPDPLTRLHHASLFLEAYLGTPIPEPASVGFVLTCAGTVLMRRRRT